MISLRRFGLLKCSYQKRLVHYTQGQSPESNVREYFYYIDHQGMLFLDDARIKNFTSCFKEKMFLKFFFKRMKKNDTGRYMCDFPYLSLCGKERNYVRCDDVPIVFTNVINSKYNQQELLSYGHAGESLVVPFEPEKICMNVQTGRVYHPAPIKVGGVGLIRSKLAIEFSPAFEFKNYDDSDPTHFTWKGTRYKLDTQWYHKKIS